jgi:hypothetical protein
MLRRAVCLLMFLIAALQAGAQVPAYVGVRQPRILLLVDGSSSMLQTWGPKATRFQTASKIITSLMDSIYAVNADVEFGLRVYGHQTAAQYNDCTDTKREVMFSKNNITQMGLRLASIRPFGVSPIAYSLKEAADNDLDDDARNAYSIILLTDGSESCGGDICDVVQTLIERKIYFKPYIISLVDYAPLRQQYSCLGSYLVAAKPDDIPNAIRTIVDAYRKQLSAPIMAVKVEAPPTKMVVTIPKVDTVVIPKWIPDRSTVQGLTIAVPRAFSTSVYRPLLHKMAVPTKFPVSKPEPAPVVIIPLPVVPPVASLSMIASPQLPVRRGRSIVLSREAMPRTFPVDKPELEPLPPVTFMAGVSLIASRVVPTRAFTSPSLRRGTAPRTVPVAKPEPEAVAVLTPAVTKPKRDTIDIVVPMSRRTDTIVATVPIIKRDTVVAVKPKPRDTATKTSVVIRSLDTAKTVVKVNKPKPNPTTAAANKPTEMPFKQETVDAKETSLAVLFTDGRGKFYNSTPFLQLLDAVTGKEVKRFHRTVDASGNPDPQVIAPGTYNLLIAGRSNMLMRRITIEPNKLNRVIVKVNSGSLRFRYEDAPGRPMTEFEAIVNIRFEPGPTIKQRCTAELEYQPGNYYIEINTTPISRFNVDIDFGAVTEIQIPQPGFVQFTNTSPKGRISLFHPLGNQFVRFVDMNITGSPAAQKIRLKPGAYEVHWVKTPNMPFATETVEKFVVQSNSVTEVELR